jgi:signal transduction histidine kinase
MDMMTDTMSHELRTPLNIMLGIGKVIEVYVVEQTGKKYLKIMMNSAKLLHYLVNDLLDLLKIKSGKF